eukprot:9478399-Pyramimonas_sp.AAC.2
MLPKRLAYWLTRVRIGNLGRRRSLDRCRNPHDATSLVTIWTYDLRISAVQTCNNPICLGRARKWTHPGIPPHGSPGPVS